MKNYTILVIVTYANCGIDSKFVNFPNREEAEVAFQELSRREVSDTFVQVKAVKLYR